MNQENPCPPAASAVVGSAATVRSPRAANRKYPGIRAPLHPLQLRCDSSPYSPGTPSLSRLAGAAHRRSRCFRLFARRYTRPDPRGRAAAPALFLLLLLLAAVPSEAADTVSVDV